MSIQRAQDNHKGFRLICIQYYCDDINSLSSETDLRSNWADNSFIKNCASGYWYYSTWSIRGYKCKFSSSWYKSFCLSPRPMQTGWKVHWNRRSKRIDIHFRGQYVGVVYCKVLIKSIVFDLVDRSSENVNYVINLSK